jgi:hypothetical protein
MSVSENETKSGSTTAAIALSVCVSAPVVFFIGGANMWTAIAVLALATMGGTMSFLLLRARS